MQKQQCLVDTDCPARLICTLNAPWNPPSDKGYCECAMNFGWDDISNNCMTLSPSFYLQLISNIFFTAYMVFLFLFLFIDYLFLLQMPKVPKLSTLPVTVQIILISMILGAAHGIVEIEDSLRPGRYTLLSTYKVSATWQYQASLLFLGSLTCMTGCLNLSICWAETAMKTKIIMKQSDKRLLNNYSRGLRTLQFLFFVAGAVVFFMLEFIFLLVVTIFIGFIVIGSFTYGSRLLTDLLQESPSSETSLTHLSRRIKATSRRTVISLTAFISTSIILTLYRIFYAHVPRIDHAESVTNRPMIYFQYFLRFFAYNIYTIIVMYLHHTIKRLIIDPRYNDSKKQTDSKERKPTHPSSHSTVKVIANNQLDIIDHPKNQNQSKRIEEIHVNIQAGTIPPSLSSNTASPQLVSNFSL